MSIDKIHQHENKHENENERILDPFFAIQKKMANSSHPPSSQNYFINTQGKRVYHSKEDERVAEIESCMPRSHFTNEVISKSQRFLHHGQKQQQAEPLLRVVTATRNIGVKDNDQPISVKWLSAAMINQKQNLAPTSNMVEDPANINYSADHQVASQIVNSLKENELSSGREYSAADIEQLIRQRFPGVNDNIIEIAVDMIMYDGQDFKGRLAGAFPNFKMLVSARNPKMQPQQQTEQQENQSNSDLGNTSFAGYMHMNHCLQDQAITHGLSKDQAVRTCSKLLQDHTKRMEEQQQPTYNTKTA